MKQRIKLNPLHNYEAGYKKRKSGKLMWISCCATSQTEAAKIADNYVNNTYPNQGYTRYAGPLSIKH